MTKARGILFTHDGLVLTNVIFVNKPPLPETVLLKRCAKNSKIKFQEATLQQNPLQ
jgi:hypothetical protein